uniref:Uncharacterized protein n=1 Tax=Arundo donax TaxID=35708 RepID=A0A0A9G1C9_ARUDO
MSAVRSVLKKKREPLPCILSGMLNIQMMKEEISILTVMMLRKQGERRG